MVMQLELGRWARIWIGFSRDFSIIVMAVIETIETIVEFDIIRRMLISPHLHTFELLTTEKHFSGNTTDAQTKQNILRVVL